MHIERKAMGRWTQWLKLSCPEPRNAKDGQQPPETRRVVWNTSFPRDFRNSLTLPNLDFGLLTSGIVREYISLVLRFPVSGTLDGSPRKLIPQT